MNERWKLCRGASNGGASEGGAIHDATSGGQSGEASDCGVTHSRTNAGGVRGLDRRDASKRRINCRGADKVGMGSRVKCGGASDGADGSESSSWPNSASSRGAIEGVDCGRIGGRCSFGIFSREEPLSHSRLHFGLDPLLKNFVQFLAQIGGPVQAGEMEGLDGSFGRSAEIFERPVDGVLLRRRALHPPWSAALAIKISHTLLPSRVRSSSTGWETRRAIGRAYKRGSGAGRTKSYGQRRREGDGGRKGMIARQSQAFTICGFSYAGAG
jgi:hypothetical protein